MSAVDMMAQAPSRRHQLCADGAWFPLPPMTLPDGGRAQRLNVPLGGRNLFSVVVSATGAMLGVSFELVEHRSGADHGSDPRLGRVVIDGQTECVGLVETVQTTFTFSGLSTHWHDRLIRRLRHGTSLEMMFDERHIASGLGGFRPLFDGALRTICDPQLLPVERWLQR